MDRIPIGLIQLLIFLSHANTVTNPAVLHFSLELAQGKSAQPKIVFPAGIAGIQRPWMAQASHVPVSWMPALHAGMTS
jgi:hypothetical protein